MTTSWLPFPRPRLVEMRSGSFRIPDAPTIVSLLPNQWQFPALDALREQFPDASIHFHPTDGPVPITLSEAKHLPPDGFEWEVTESGLRLQAGGRNGAFYGIEALSQIVKKTQGQLPCFRMRDTPDFSKRAFMLDISRGKVPTLETLFGLVTLLSRLRYNQLQLYIEHTFAYTGHEEVWAQASPLTAAEIRALDAFCQSRCVEFVPNQNSFGHLEHWFEHPRYLPLAELPQGGAPLPWGGTRDYPSALSPEGEGAIHFLADLYDQLLPHFTSRTFNIGCDEVFDLRGNGRSAARVQREGEDVVFLDYLHRVTKLVTDRGFSPQFWADMVLTNPEHFRDIPHSCTALVWGYEANHPFQKQCETVHRAGVPFYVCPGTSSWRSLAGRIDNMRGNIAAAVSAGKKYGAIGFMLCDWGDAGHFQPLTITYPALVEAAGMSWCEESNNHEHLANTLEEMIVAPGLGKILIEVGNFYQTCGALRDNASELFQLFTLPLDRPPAEGITSGRLQQILQRTDELCQSIKDAQSGDSHEWGIQKQELHLVCQMVRIACLRGFLKCGEEISLHPDAKTTLEREFTSVWRLRNRASGSTLHIPW